VHVFYTGKEFDWKAGPWLWRAVCGAVDYCCTEYDSLTAMLDRVWEGAEGEQSGNVGWTWLGRTASGKCNKVFYGVSSDYLERHTEEL
jgi:hypothetical protein